MRPVRSWKWLTLALVALVLVVPGVPPTRPAGAQGGGTLVVGLDQEPPDPRSARLALRGDLPDHRLGDREPRSTGGPTASSCPGSPSPGRVARDGRSVTFKLRRDVKFHDGTPFNADAVKFNFDRIVDPKFKAGGSRAALARLRGLEGARRVHRAGALRDPLCAVPELGGLRRPLASSRRRRCARAATPVHTRPVGTGPFMIKDYVAKDHATMVRFPGYARKAPWSDRSGPAQLETVVWKFIPEPGTRVTTLESGETQGIYLVPAQSLPRLEKDPALPRREAPVAGRAAHLAAQRHEAAARRRAGAPRDQLRGRQGRVPRHRVQGHRRSRPSRRSPRSCSTIRRCARPTRSIPRRPRRCWARRAGQPGADGIRAKGGPAARDRAERHRVRRRRRTRPRSSSSPRSATSAST